MKSPTSPRFTRARFIGAMLAWILIGLAPAPSRAEVEYVKLSFGDDVSIDVPRHWTILDEALRQKIKSSAEAMFKLGGLDYQSGKDQVLVAANGYISPTENSGTMRLSVNPSPTMSQEQVIAATDEGLAPIGAGVKETLEQATKETKEPQKVSDVVTRREKLGKYQAVVVEYTRTSTVTGKKVFVQVNVVHLKTRSVKLTTSYHDSAAATVRPVVQAIRNSLVIP